MTEADMDVEMASFTGDEDIDDELVEEEIDEEEQLRRNTNQLRKSLFAAVEEGDDEDEESSHSDDDEDDIDRGTVLSYRPFLRLFAAPGSQSKSSRKQIILDAVQGLHKGYARRFFAGLKPIVQHVIETEEYVPLCMMQGDGETMSQSFDSTVLVKPDEVVPDAKSSAALKFLLYSTECLQAYLAAVVKKHFRRSTAGQTVSVITEAFDIVVLLHGLLAHLNDCGPDALTVQDAIVSLCEAWWHSNVTNRIDVVGQVLTLLVFKALNTEGKLIHIRRLWSIRDAFNEVDFGEDTSDELKFRILKLASSPLVIKQNEGKRFLSYLFLIDPVLTTGLHQAIRSQIPDAKRPILKAYSEIYKKAWKDSANEPPEIRMAIEDVLQDLMNTVVHAAVPKTTKTLLLILEPFHEAKKSTEVEGLLHRLYAPILWRALTAANPEVRINASKILGEVFPLRDPALAQANAAFKKAIDALKALLEDSHPKVRVAASEVVAKILGTYWDIFAAGLTDDIWCLLNHIVAKHASDATSYQVRAGALKAITALLDSDESHAALRPFLPKLGNLIHDNNKTVRLAAVDFLLKIKELHGIKYYHVVPVEHLKARLADEGRRSKGNSTVHDPYLFRSPVASKLTQLMRNSFVPLGNGIKASDQVMRTLSFLHTDPEAAAVFYANLYEHFPISAMAKLIAMLFKCVVVAVETEKQKESAKKKKLAARGASDGSEDCQSDIDSNSDDGGSEDEILKASNIRLMASIAEVIDIMWDSILDELDYDENITSRDFLDSKFSGRSLTDILCHFDKRASQCPTDDIETCNDYDRIRSAFLRISGYLEPDDLDGLFPYISSSLASLTSKKLEKKIASSTSRVSTHIALLCVWGMAEDVAKSLSSSIISVFDDGHDADDSMLLSPLRDNTKKRKNRRSSVSSSRDRTSDLLIPQLDGNIALKVLDEILKGEDTSIIGARDSFMENEKAREKLEDALEQGSIHAGRMLHIASAFTQTLNDRHFKFIIKLCDVYGRFALHKASYLFKVSQTPLDLNLDAKHLLEVATEHVLPSLLTDTKRSPLQELDLSRISFANDSMLADGGNLLGDPQTPGLTPLAPPRKKGNRNATPERLDNTFQVSGKKPNSDPRNDSKIVPGDSTVLLIRSASLSILQTVCLVFSEWLMVGDGSGSQEIMQSARKWVNIFESTCAKGSKENIKKTNIERWQLQLDLVPSFARLSVALGQYSSNFELLKSLLASLICLCNQTEGKDIDAEEKVSSTVGGAISNLLNKCAAPADVVAAVLDVVYEELEAIRGVGLIDKSTMDTSDDSEEMPVSMHDAICERDNYEADSSVIGTALESISKHKQGSFILCKQLSTKFLEHASQRNDDVENDNNQASQRDSLLLFEAKCLWVLWESGASRKSAETEEIFRKFVKDEKIVNNTFDIPCVDSILQQLGDELTS